VLKDFPGSSHRILASWAETLPAGSRVLEIGVGRDPFLRLVRRDDLQWVGMDANLNCLRNLHQMAPGGVIVDAEVLPRLPRGFETIVLADTLEHFTNHERMLVCVREALPPQGSLLLSVPNVAHWAMRLHLLFGHFDYADRGILDRTHRVFFTRRTLRNLLLKSGFTIERQAVSTLPLPLALPSLPAWLRAVFELAQRIGAQACAELFGYQLLVLARRQ
jgi:2-polyprenyl-3-methyl-5-hydroxy-6-metoxy-1,4-benzoquinol methylase